MFAFGSSLFAQQSFLWLHIFQAYYIIPCLTVAKLNSVMYTYAHFIPFICCLTRKLIPQLDICEKCHDSMAEEVSL